VERKMQNDDAKVTTGFIPMVLHQWFCTIGFSPMVLYQWFCTIGFVLAFLMTSE
jgi:hypothetical protein